MRLAVALLVAVATTAHADPTPESRAKAMLTAQLDAVKYWGSPELMVATFTVRAIELLDGAANWKVAVAASMVDVLLPAKKASDPPLAMNAFVLALPIAGDKWSVIAASYGEEI